MAKLTTKVTIPIILVGVFAMAALIAVIYAQSGIIFYFVISFLVIFVLFSGIAIGQNLTSPIKKILDQATELSKGNLSSRIDLETKDEFSELAKIFNKIAEELEASHLQEENTEKSVGIKVKARTQEMEETINALEQKVKNRSIELERLTKELNVLQEAERNQNKKT